MQAGLGSHFMKHFVKYGNLQILSFEEHWKKLGMFKSEEINRGDIITVFTYVRHRRSKEGINYILEWKVVGWW